MSDKKRVGKAKTSKKRRAKRGLDWMALAREFALPVTLMGACALGVAWSRPVAAAKYEKLGKESDIYAIPSGDQLVLFSLGYRAAVADLLFGRTMVAAGVHFSEKRVFHHLDAYLKGILALEPRYLDVYRYADGLLNLSTVEMPPENLRIARDIQEQGLKEFPHEAELWMSVGQFTAYLAPQRLPEGEDEKEWRLAGARMIQHACDIWPLHDKVPDTCLGAATLLSKNGEEAAAIQALERMVAMVDDEKIRKLANDRLRRLMGARAARQARERIEALDTLRRSDMPLAGRLRYQLLSPPFDESKCQGTSTSEERLECASSFDARSRILAQQRGRSVD